MKSHRFPSREECLSFIDRSENTKKNSFYSTFLTPNFSFVFFCDNFMIDKKVNRKKDPVSIQIRILSELSLF